MKKDQKVDKGASTQAIKKAKRVAKLKKAGQNVKSHKTHTKVRFYRPKTLRLSRTPKFARRLSSLVKNTNNFDKYNVIKNPLTTEKAMKKMEEENTLVFLVDINSGKAKIRKAFEMLYNAKVRQVNTLIRYPSFNSALTERRRHMLD